MLRILVELWPHGDASLRETIAEIGIANMTPGLDPARYGAVVVHDDGVETHLVAHQRDDGWAALLRAVLNPATEAPSAAVRDAILARLRTDDDDAVGS